MFTERFEKCPSRAFFLCVTSAEADTGHEESRHFTVINIEGMQVSAL
jgi:hypothetical protein